MSTKKTTRATQAKRKARSDGARGPARKKRKSKSQAASKSGRTSKLAQKRKTKPKSRAVEYAPSLDDYCELLARLDFFQGRRGEQSISRRVEPLLRALHQVLAGGTLGQDAIRVEGPVDESTVNKLDQLVLRSLEEANRINDRRMHVCFG